MLIKTFTSIVKKRGMFKNFKGKDNGKLRYFKIFYLNIEKKVKLKLYIFTKIEVFCLYWLYLLKTKNTYPDLKRK